MHVHVLRKRLSWELRVQFARSRQSVTSASVPHRLLPECLDRVNLQPTQTGRRHCRTIAGRVENLAAALRSALFRLCPFRPAEHGWSR
jgi:hypothetical protein